MARLCGQPILDKKKAFMRDRLVAKDRTNLMFCPTLDCEAIIDLRQAGHVFDVTGRMRRAVRCSVCKGSACKLCRQEYHGE